MLRRLFQLVVLLGFAALSLRHADLGALDAILHTHWRAFLFALATALGVWLFWVTQDHRPVVVIFTVAALSLIAVIEGPNVASLLAAIDGLAQGILGDIGLG
ncbi:MAG: hypothetical protein HKN18_01500 [Silicimonas sp.]|nr:hypothetical protein [Silicimonas sp.]